MSHSNSRLTIDRLTILILTIRYNSSLSLSLWGVHRRLIIFVSTICSLKNVSWITRWIGLGLVSRVINFFNFNRRPDCWLFERSGWFYKFCLGSALCSCGFLLFWWSSGLSLLAKSFGGLMLTFIRWSAHCCGCTKKGDGGLSCPPPVPAGFQWIPLESTWIHWNIWANLAEKMSIFHWNLVEWNFL